MEVVKPFVAIIEDYDGNKIVARVFAESKEEAQNKLIKEYPRCYVETISMEEYNARKEISKQEVINRTREYDEMKKKCDKLKHLLRMALPFIRSYTTLYSSTHYDMTLIEEIEKEIHN